MPTTQRGCKISRFLTWLSLAIVVTIGSSVAAAPLEQAPISGATRVITIDPDNSTDAVGTPWGVEQPWLSDHEVLHLRRGLYRYDVRAKTDIPLTQFTHQVKTSHCYLYFLDASPNGRNVIWGMSSNNPFFVSPLSGVRRAQWPSDNGMSEPHWCADGKHWMQFYFGGDPQHMRRTSIQVHSLDVPQVSQTFSSPPQGLNGLDILAAPSAEEIIARTPDPVMYKMPKPDKVINHDDGTRVQSFTAVATLRDRQMVSVWSLHRPQPLRRYAIVLPGRAKEVAVSSDGQHVAWLLTTGRTPSQSLWTSRLDGSRMRKIGRVRPGRMVHGQPISFVFQLYWVPGNKQVSFLYGDALWTVPAE